jgi:Cu(I)/Ag(I) efflux system membrane fusion protein
MSRVLSFALLVVLLAVPALANQGVSAVVDPYLRIQETLAADKTTGVRDQAGAIVSAAGKLGKPAEAVVAAARQLQMAGNLEASRDAFFALSSALFKFADATGTSLGPEVRRAYCPMEKKSWAQKDGQIANPYAGSRMLRCGEFTDRKKS